MTTIDPRPADLATPESFIEPHVANGSAAGEPVAVDPSSRVEHGSTAPPPYRRSKGRRSLWASIIAVGLIAAIVVAGWATNDQWRPAVQEWISWGPSTPVSENHADHHGHDELPALVLTDTARRNLGLRTMPVEVGNYWRTMNVPGRVIERPGHAHRKVAATMTGVVRELYVRPNQLLRPEDPVAFFDLAGETLARAQAEFLAAARDLDINVREIERIRPNVASGLVAGGQLRELEYERQRLESLVQTREQTLQVLGFSRRQIADIERTGNLLTESLVAAPAFTQQERRRVSDVSANGSQVTSAFRSPGEAPIDEDWSYTVESIQVHPGDRLEPGDVIAELAFHSLLYIEGRAFEHEMGPVTRAMIEGWPVVARFDATDEREGLSLTREGLQVVLVSNLVEDSANTSSFFVPLRNEVLHDRSGPEGEIYRTWRFKPGQRVLLQIPVEHLERVIVLPSDAVARDGLESFVFRVSGDKLERQAIRIIHRGVNEVIIANDGSIFPGEIIAANYAYQLNLALKMADGEMGHGHHHDHDH